MGQGVGTRLLKSFTAAADQGAEEHANRAFSSRENSLSLAGGNSPSSVRLNTGLVDGGTRPRSMTVSAGYRNNVSEQYSSFSGDNQYYRSYSLRARS